MELANSKFLLDESHRQLEYIEQYYLQSLNEKHISMILLLKIKHFLEDAKSSLDYAAYQIFSEHCTDKIKSKLEDHERNVYFPNKRSKKKFDEYIQNVFPGIAESLPKVVTLFERTQSFNEPAPEWFSRLNELCNTNKHRHLTPQDKQIINNQSTIDFINCTVSGNGGTFMKIGDVEIDVPRDVPFSGTVSINHTWVNIMFSDLNIPVLPTLRDIYSGATAIINELGEILLGV